MTVNNGIDSQQALSPTSSVTFANTTLADAGALRTTTTLGNTILLQAYDNDTGPAYVTFATLTAGNTPTMDLSDDVTKAGGYIYRAGGTDIPVADGGTGASTLTGVLVGNGTSAVTGLALTDGQVAIGNTGSAPTAGALTPGTGISIVNAAGSITLNAVGAGLTWSVVTGATQAMTSNNGYIANRAGTVAFSLPTTSAVGDIIAVTGINTATGWSIGYTTNQQIFFGTSASTITTGNIASINIRDTVFLVCVTQDLTWNVFSVIGNITVV